MILARVLTHWVVDEDGANSPAVLSFLQNGDSAVDVTGQPAENLPLEVNAVVWEIACEQSTIDAINNSSDIILWQREIVNE